MREYRFLLKGAPCELVSLAECGISHEVEETGATFEENASCKALEYASLAGTITLADDSGLEVDALGGEPGVKSARYAGENATDNDRVNYLLSRLVNVPWEKRTASFKCVIAIAIPYGEVKLCFGSCTGYIALEPKGSLGFGYDPVFYVPELDRTMSELTLEEKSRISHRSEAAKNALPLLMSLFHDKYKLEK